MFSTILCREHFKSLFFFKRPSQQNCLDILCLTSAFIRVVAIVTQVSNVALMTLFLNFKHESFYDKAFK